MIDDSNPFKGCTFAECLAYTYHRNGAEGLQQLLDHLAEVKRDTFHRQSLAAELKELRQTGLDAVANQIEAFMKTRPHQWELPCPWPDNPGHGHLVAQWKQDMQAKRKAWEKRNSPSSG